MSLNSSTNKRIISFDVGIKNMAYCIFDVVHTESSPTITILDWNILNLSKSSLTTAATNNSDVPSCMHAMSLGKPTKKNPIPATKLCGKKSKYHKDDFYVCEKHAKESKKWTMPKKEYSEKALQKLKMDALKTFVKNENIYFFTSIPDKIKKQELIDKVVQHYETRCWVENPKPVKAVNAGAIDLISIGRNLYSQISQIPHMKTVTHVVIENQISPIANRMKTIQGMLAQIFILYDIAEIEFVSSANKLKDFVKDSSTVVKDLSTVVKDSSTGVKDLSTGVKDSSTGVKKEKKEKEKPPVNAAYKQHKTDGVTFCRQFLGDYFTHRWATFFNESGKKDDLADSFLQGIWYINKKIITNEFNLKINNVITP